MEENIKMWYEVYVVEPPKGDTQTVDTTEDKNQAIDTAERLFKETGKFHGVDLWGSNADGSMPKKLDFDVKFLALDNFLMNSPFFRQEDREDILQTFYTPLQENTDTKPSKDGIVKFNESNVQIILSALQYCSLPLIKDHTIKIFNYMDINTQQRADTYEAMRRYVNSEL